MNAQADTAFQAAAEKVRHAMEEMAAALIEDMEGVTSTEALSALTAGTLGHAVKLWFDSCVAATVPFPKGREELDKQVDTYWKQALTGHLTAQARETNAAEGESEGGEA